MVSNNKEVVLLRHDPEFDSCDDEDGVTVPDELICMSQKSNKQPKIDVKNSIIGVRVIQDSLSPIILAAE
jgi:hypothetical protein